MQVIAALSHFQLNSVDFKQHENVSMIVMEDDYQVYDSLFALMSKSDEEEDDQIHS